MHLATEKARDIFGKLAVDVPPGADNVLVLGADTLVFIDGQMLGKPTDEEEAFKMLKGLSGKWHEVYTGVCVLVQRHTNPTVEAFSALEVSRVLFKPLHHDEIRSYIKTKEPMDKAGAYALQGTGSAFVERIEGCFTNIIGLPIPKVVSLLRQAGVEVLGRDRV